MIVKFLKPSVSFAAVFYNLNKVDGARAELMKAANFGIAGALTSMKMQDYFNYLDMVTSLNKRIEYPQLHVAISGKGRQYDKNNLSGIAEEWLKEMGYGEQPYLLVFHKDTANNHLHIVSTRIDRDGRKVSGGYEHKRSRIAINKVLGYEFAMKYRFSTKAQFLMILEARGFLGKDPDEAKVLGRAARYQTDKKRAAEIRLLLERHKANPAISRIIKDQFNIDLIFHAADGKKPYGYSIIDHERRIVFKGGEVMPLRDLLFESELHRIPANHLDGNGEYPTEFSDNYIPPVMITDDVDDQQIHGMRRRRQKKARTNTR
ncbi:relaxase/mobilization nuclease domain-containing protein [Mucilaginibacter sp. SMC90]|uniref:relaxase/mobilization nuclease domain-containing protein n=1 Tax=Mucilaginibacter sp. SMC90 TaxID=2929803 RepID=UPI001FB4A49F|nr:relaxase/mobilization nuclease domain-containing protein [Mucilaginibacter sp. SMC90]UOE47836.1 relaxase/mobilization nuclease domain-containing protein [Mucilaginibacter sp. SMC90]